jgi:hypothetical protein
LLLLLLLQQQLLPLSHQLLLLLPLLLQEVTLQRWLLLWWRQHGIWCLHSALLLAVLRNRHFMHCQLLLLLLQVLPCHVLVVPEQQLFLGLRWLTAQLLLPQKWPTQQHLLLLPHLRKQRGLGRCLRALLLLLLLMMMSIACFLQQPLQTSWITCSV